MTSKSIGTDYGWKEICVSNLQQVFAETRLEDVDLSKIIPRISPPPPGRELVLFGGAIYRRVFCVTILGGYIWRGLYMEGHEHIINAGYCVLSENRKN